MRREGGGEALLVIARLRGCGKMEIPARVTRGFPASGWERVLTSEDAAYCEGHAPPLVGLAASTRVSFEGPGALVLRGRGGSQMLE